MCFEQRQTGFSLPIAIFILVVMALLGTAIVSIMLSNQQGVSSEVLSTRAFYSAESGAQYALGRIFPLDGSPGSCQATYPTLNLTSTGLAGCSADVNCSSTTIASNVYYTITSTGSCNFAGSSAVRQLELMARGP
jgi:MSHA biogenesis protein MshP